MAYSKRYGCIHSIGRKTNNRCHLCHGKLDPDDYGPTWGPQGGDAVNVDHVWPQSWGGDDRSSNLYLTHARCNSKRGTRPVGEVRMQLAGTRRAPRSSDEVMFDVGGAALLGGVAGGTLLARPGENFNWGAAFLCAAAGALLANDW